MDDTENKHCTETLFSARYYYKGNVCCGVNDNPTHVELRTTRGSYPAFTFELPRQRHELDKFETMLNIVYTQGQEDRSRDIGKMMRGLIKL
jgi:hypothetical protein